MAAKFFTGLPLDGPDPECVKGHGEHALSTRDTTSLPKAGQDHSRTGKRKTALLGLPAVRIPDRACDTSPLAGR
jgi:hypothetical protein